jgi:hypothetical protein
MTEAGHGNLGSSQFLSAGSFYRDGLLSLSVATPPSEMDFQPPEYSRHLYLLCWMRDVERGPGPSFHVSTRCQRQLGAGANW